MSKRKNKKKPELKVVFDSNVIYTGSSSDLLNDEVLQLIKENSDHPDLNIQWYLPALVVQERKFQMIKRGVELLPAIEKLERLLGHNLAISKDLIESRVQTVIDNQIASNNLKVLELDTGQVDWGKLISDATTRTPPFDPGEKEKGFRDRIILEAFLQIVCSSPITPRVCRVALLTGDGLLSEAAESATSNQANVRVLPSIEDLKGLINTLVAEIDEEFVNSIQEKAAKYFFERDTKDTLYYSHNIRKYLADKFVEELSALPQDADMRENGKWVIFKPRFIKKEGQRITWATRISVETSSFKSETQYTSQSIIDTILGSPSITKPQSSSIIGPTVLPFQSRRLLSKGKTILEVVWSVSVSTTKKLNKPKIESYKFIESIWET